MKENKVGLYLGVNSVGAVLLKGRDIVSLGRFEFSSLDEAGAGVANEEIRWEALINKTLRELGSDTKNVFVSLADKDFIFRPLEMPIMKKKEIESSLVYEIEKYIPFKIGELVWDYDYASFPKERKVNLSFVGIKENNFERVKSILARLEFKAVIVEPACMSLVRVIKSVKKFSHFKNFALLDFTQAEAYLTFFQQDLPVFNRYLLVSKKENVFDLDSFTEAVNFSFQYFKREFKSYKLEKLIIIGDSDLESLVPHLAESLQVDIVTASSYNLTGRNNAKVENVKALGAAGLDHFPYKFKPNLRKTDEHLFSQKKSSAKVSLRMGLLSSLIGIGLVALFFLSLVLGNEVSEKRFILKKKEKSMAVSQALKGLSWPQRAERASLEGRRISSLRKVLASFTRFSGFFKELATEEMLPPRLWLGRLDVSQKGDEYTASLTGYIFCDDDYKERLGVDKFISKLKENKAIKSIFTKVELSSSDRQKIEDFEVTRFSVTLEE